MYLILLISCVPRYDDEDDYNQFAPRDPWADLSTRQSSVPINSMASQQEVINIFTQQDINKHTWNTGSQQ